MDLNTQHVIVPLIRIEKEIEDMEEAAAVCTPSKVWLEDIRRRVRSIKTSLEGVLDVVEQNYENEDMR